MLFVAEFGLRKMSSTPTPKHPKFISVEGSYIYSRSKPDGFRFSLVSYTILAQSSLFPHSPPPSLKWKARSNAILAVLKNFGADFLCLQEVDEYDSFYKENMENFGYSSIYMKRSGKKRDGCGLLYKHDCAELVFEERIEYNDLVKSIPDGKLDDEYKDDLSDKQDLEPKNDSAFKKAPEDRGDPNDPHVRLKRDCVGILAAFTLKDPSHHVIIVANTHLYWNPEWT
ncbi:carbon catabolite repressor protein 4-like 4 [Quillaja saponaria]|uniref:Carbon catabolite repressor protein 4-like 4 n=1 Tax=Quillaja saponaria TaxID=32244 RepID=A0AAD7KQQ5_QUISA|nr:carbon catabolite repressor protein 4-like 4 [Quillaja saponaria]